VVFVFGKLVLKGKHSAVASKHIKNTTLKCKH